MNINLRQREGKQLFFCLAVTKRVGFQPATEAGYLTLKPRDILVS